MSEEKKEVDKKEIEKKPEEKKEMKKEVKKKSKSDKSVSDQIKENPWILGTLVFGILTILLLLGNFGTAGAISKDVAGQNFVDYINARGGSQIEYLDAVAFGSSLYEVSVSANGKTVPAHITADGKYFVQIISTLEDNEEVEEKENPSEGALDLPKSDKPVVELFIMSHCPYGTQAEKGMLPVVELLGDKIDFELRFVYYAMHPTSGEVEEQLNQYCIQGEQEELFNDYLTCFLGKTGTPDDGAACVSEVGVNKAKMTACTAKADSEFNVLANLEDKSSWLSGRYPMFDIHKDLNTQYDIGGSPTLVVNGKQASSGRAPANYLDAICQAFNVAPEECDESLSSASYNPGFGWSEASSGSTDAQCG